MLDSEAGYVLDQEVTFDLMLQDHGLESANGDRTPIGKKRSEEETQGSELLVASHDGELASIMSFQSLVDSLLWIARCTRPDICFAVDRETRQTYKPTMRHCRMAKQIARYLKETESLKLCVNSTSQPGALSR